MEQVKHYYLWSSPEVGQEKGYQRSGDHDAGTCLSLDGTGRDKGFQPPSNLADSPIHP